MKQVVQSFKTGELAVKEVPWPQLTSGFVLVENRASLISSGTERGTVQVAQANLLQKARQRPDLVAQVLQNLRKEGLKATLDKVKTKLDTPKALGYSSAGIVLASLDTHNRLQPGQRVACAGQDMASHAEIVAVPQNLVVPIPDEVSFEEAAFTTLGAIALQGVRQAEVSLGENVAVIGLGLLGQLTVQLLKAAGCRVMGLDLQPSLVALARESGADLALERHDNTLPAQAREFTAGHGFDKVIITASAPTNDPVNLAAELAARKGVIVVVGDVAMELQREPHFYKKELELRMSCSYGPGRYDADYELLGKDYPYAYVRWTEQRNMAAFLDMVARQKVKLDHLISHRFDINEAVEAYKLVTGEAKDDSLGIILEYPEGEKKKTVEKNKIAPVTGKPSVAFIGAGSFAQSYLIPHVQSHASLRSVLAGRGINAEHVASKFGFAKAVSEVADILTDEAVQVVFVATQHNTHAEYTSQCLRAGKHVFVEKPLALNMEQLQEVAAAYEESAVQLGIGFNRRFSPAARLVKAQLPAGVPLMMNFRVNAGTLPPDHWSQLAEIGGGRIIGEVCHFIDLMQYFSGSLPVEVQARALPGRSAAESRDDELVATLRFADGSLGTVIYTASGGKRMPKEHLEIFAAETSWVIDDFKRVSVYKEDNLTHHKTSGKGHREEVQAFLDAVIAGAPFEIDFNSMYRTTLATFKILDARASGLPQEI